MIKVFAASFIAGVLLLGGLVALGALFWPALLGPLSEIAAPQPQLPLAADRTEAYFDIDRERVRAKQLYPALTEVGSTVSGDWIRIPAIGVEVPLVLSSTIQDADVIATLASGAALYPNGVHPGGLGKTFISAHSTGEPWKGRYRFAFLRINELAAGNLIHIDFKGTRYTYRIADIETITPQPDSVLISDRPVPTITLMACWPLWSTKQRMLVHGELANVTKLTASPS